MRLQEATGRCTASIDLAAYRRNLSRISAIAGETPLYPVVKANAYGHGLVEVARAAAGHPSVAGLCVATLEEGVALRDAGLGIPILVLLPRENPTEAAARDLMLSVSSPDDVKRYGGDGSPRVHLEVDTGMHRMGVSKSELGAVLELARDLGVPVVGSSPTSPRRTRTTSSLPTGSSPLSYGPRTGWRSPATRPTAPPASGSLGPSRPGSPGHRHLRAGSLRTLGGGPGAGRPVLRLDAVIHRVAVVEPGEGVGYGLEDAASSRRTIATVGVGYGDGYPRALGHGAPVLVGGRRCSTVGRVSMDSIAVDITDNAVHPGDRAVLIGAEGPERITAEELARLAGTINYEITTRLLPRASRRFIDPEASGREDRSGHSKTRIKGVRVSSGLQETGYEGEHRWHR